METESTSVDQPTFSFKTLSQPRFLLIAWFIGYWFAIAALLCFVDYRKATSPADKLSTNIYIICYHTCLAQLLAILTLAFFADRRHWLLSPLLGIAGALATLAIFRVFNSEYIQDVWPFFAAYPAMFLAVCLASRAVVSLCNPHSGQRPTVQITIVDVLLLTFVAACFLSLSKIAIFDLNHVFWNDPKRIYAFHPEVTGRFLRAIDLSAVGLAFVAITRVRNSLPYYLLLIPLAICICATMSLAIHFGLSIFDGRKPWETTIVFQKSLLNVAFNAMCFFAWFACSIAIFRALGLLPARDNAPSCTPQIA
jgi:hypothetical protein